MSLRRLLGFGTETDAGPDDRDADDTRMMRRIAAELEALPAAGARYLAAFACILGRVAQADSSVSAEETAKMQEIVQVLGHLPPAQAALIVEIAKNQVRLFGGTDNFLVSRRFKELSTGRQRIELLDCIFAVSAADESITVAEEGQARQISRELGLTHKEFVAARAHYVEHFEALKAFRRQRASGAEAPGGSRPA
jgi:uncharacterized tellurite resistance protein B-like protein